MQRRSRLLRLSATISLIAIGSVVGVALVTRVPGSRPTGGPAGPADVVSSPGAAITTPAPSTGTAVAPSPNTSVDRPSPGASASSGPPIAPPIPPPIAPVATSAAGRHVWWIVLENHEYGSIVGSRSAPYMNGLIARYGLARRYYATTHPSEPNYVALVAGSTLGVTTDGTYHLAGASLFSELTSAGRSWRVYAQDDPAGCFTGVSARGGRDGPGAAGTYARKHNPAISFASVAGDAGQCHRIQPLRAFDPAAAPFELIVPNLTNDMHDGTIGQGDAFLRALVPRILASAAFRTGGALFVTFDEGSTSAGSHGDRGGHVATLIVTPNLQRGFRYTAYADHWSLLRTTETILGLPCLGEACHRSPMIR
jgi:phosphatidylinositol-3-phosphatase